MTATRAFRSITTTANSRYVGLMRGHNARIRTVGRVVGRPLSGGPTLVLSDVLEIHESTLEMLDNERKTPCQNLMALRQHDAAPHHKWAAAIQVQANAQLHCAGMYGFGHDQEGINAAARELHRVESSNQEDEELRELVEGKFKVILDRGFGMDFEGIRRIDVGEARRMSTVLTLRMQSDEFLAQVDQLKRDHPVGEGASPGDAEVQALNLALIDAIAPLQEEVCGDFGFVGDGSYIEFQVSLLQHQYDSQINQAQMAAMMAVFQRAGQA